MSDVATVRGFNRFYTNVIGVLRDGRPLTESRVVFELGQRDEAEVADLRRTLDIDAGYLSRLLSRFATDGLVDREQSTKDARRQTIRLTDKGRALYRELDRRTEEQIGAMLAPLTPDGRRRLVAAMSTIHRVLSGEPRPTGYLLRPPEVGDLGWVLRRHGTLYAEEFGWNGDFEKLVARIIADDLLDPDPEREAGWIAEVDGEPVGSVFCARVDDETAKLRLLLVDPAARGLGIGGRLVDECVRFARRAGYRKMVLMTYDLLADARQVYRKRGFELTAEKPERAFGKDMVRHDYTLNL